MTIDKYIIKQTTSTVITDKSLIQNLWSDYGTISRYYLGGGPLQSIVAKEIRCTQNEKHPRGWNSSISHQRKVKSYEVETYWYDRYAKKCDATCRIPKCIGINKTDETVIFLLEDLSNAGFPVVKESISISEMKTCLSWLANFHATFMKVEPEGLWEVGTYWHLATRPEELEALKDEKLKIAAPAIDLMLNECSFKTLVHGDAKLANFCFSEDGLSAAAVDFQYVGGGCGMKDVAYFLGSCMNDQACEIHEKELLNHYFQALNKAVQSKSPGINFNELEQEWRQLFPIAWADFHRFLKGWSPGHWKLNAYSERLTSQVIQKIEKTTTNPPLNSDNLTELAAIAVSVAKKAGELIFSQRKKQHNQIQKTGGNTLASQIVTEVDFLSQEMILSSLIPTCEKFNLGLLSEEKMDDNSRLSKDYFWCIDPLDGTLPFVEGTAGYAVSIALVSRQGEAVIGIVYDPEEKIMYQAIKDQGCLRNGVIWKLGTPANGSNFTFASNRSLKDLPSYVPLKKNIDQLSKKMQFGQTVEYQFAGAVMNAIGILENQPGCYVALPKKDDGGGSIWDYAATVCIFAELGLQVTNCQGKPLFLNDSTTTFMNKQGVIFSSDPKLGNRLLADINRMER